MRKIECNCENPLDNILIHISDYLCPYAYKYGFNPNIITTISLLFCIISGLLLLKSYYIISAIFFLLSYLLDCMDGHFARKYNMVTIFGDYYDHFSDFTKIILILYILYIIDSKIIIMMLPVIILLLFLMSIHLGCQELYYGKIESHSLNITKSLCPVYDINNKLSIEKVLEYTRYFGCGTFMLFIALIIIYYGVNKK
jgi:phosphatidylglycerophosphate synthase